MDFIAEIVMEMLGTAIVEGGVDAASDHRRPKWQRVLILTMLALLFTAVVAVLFLVGIAAFGDIPLVSLFLLALGGVWVFLGIR